MDKNHLSIEVKKVINTLGCSEIASYIDQSLTPPDPFRGRGEIRLIILGQDPTVQDPEYRKKIKVTLLLNHSGGLRTYNAQKGPAILPEGGRPLDSFAQRGN